MAVFETVPDNELASLVNWIADGDTEEGALANLVEALLPQPYDCAFANQPALRAAWNSRGVLKTAASLRLAQLEDWHHAEQDADELEKVVSWARKYAINVRFSLLEAAEPEQIADGLETLADVLNQDLGERTATFIIEMVANTQLPLYPVNALFAHVAMTEPGKIRPASFTKRMQLMTARWRLARLAVHGLRAFVDHLEPALTYFREHLYDHTVALGKFYHVVKFADRWEISGIVPLRQGVRTFTEAEAENYRLSEFFDSQYDDDILVDERCQEILGNQDEEED